MVVEDSENQGLLMQGALPESVHASRQSFVKKTAAVAVVTLLGVALYAGGMQSLARVREKGLTGQYSEQDFLVSPSSTQSKMPTASTTRKGSFLVIGDWGYDHAHHYENINGQRCVRAIAQAMLEKMEELGDVKFIINVGDSFYPEGVASKDDPQWQWKWRDVFPAKLRSVPWYSVYGNHDLHRDPCACSDDLTECAQINKDPDNLDFFRMHSYTYWEPIPDFDMELVAMDLNHFMGGWNHKLGKKDQGFADCQWTACKGECYKRFEIRANVSLDLFWQRFHKSPAKNLVVFSHYPTDYFIGGAPEFLDGLRNNSKHDIVYFGGHRHSVDDWSTCSVKPNQNWLVGGGGGWSCDSDQQGFVVGEIQADYTVTTKPVLVDKDVCCIYPTSTSTSTVTTTPAPESNAAKEIPEDNFATDVYSPTITPENNVAQDIPENNFATDVYYPTVTPENNVAKDIPENNVAKDMYPTPTRTFPDIYADIP